MDRIRRALAPTTPYKPLDSEPRASISDEDDGLSRLRSEIPEPQTPATWLDIAIFTYLGIAMLWAWNMFLAAAPFFQVRFASSEWIFTNFQSCILTVSTITALLTISFLTKTQATASFSSRLYLSYGINVGCFLLLALSTVVFTDVVPSMYFVFVLLMVLCTTISTALCQGGLFPYASALGGSYIQVTMVGQSLAGILPCIAQIILALRVPGAAHEDDGQGSGAPRTEDGSNRSALLYFLIAAGVSSLAALAFMYTIRHHPEREHPVLTLETSAPALKQPSSMWSVFNKVRAIALSVTLAFAITMFFPVFTAQILSVNTPRSALPDPSVPSSDLPQESATANSIFSPAAFIPLGFLFWNSGDFFGRLLPFFEFLRLTRFPRFYLILSILRIGFIPLYYLCNIRGRGAIVESDLFYLLVVQFCFGLTHGLFATSGIIGANDYVDDDERETVGGLMSFMLTLGLTIGSVASFSVA